MATYLLIRPNTTQHLNLHQHGCENLTAHTLFSKKFMMIVMFVVMMMMMIIIMIIMMT